MSNNHSPITVKDDVDNNVSLGHWSRADPGIYLGGGGANQGPQSKVKCEARIEGAKPPSIEGKARVEGAKRPRIEGKAQTEGEAQEQQAGEGSAEGARCAPPRI